MREAITILLTLVITASIYAQTVTGRVVDASNGNALPGANVYLQSNWQIGTSTGTEGSFTLNVPAEGDSLIVSFIGYKEQMIFVKGGTEELIVKLSAIAGTMDEVVVEADPLIAEEFTFQKVNRLEIYKNPSAKADPLLAVNALPSSTTLDESANISFRGSSPAETGIFINNVPIYDAIRFSQLNGIGTFSIFNTAIVDELFVFPGNPPLEYGNTTSGLVAIQTTEHIPEKGSNQVTLSLANFGALTSQPLSTNSGITIFTNYQPSAFITSINEQALEDIDWFSSNDLGIHFIHKTDNGGLLKVFNYSLNEGYDFNYQAPTFSGLFKQRKRRNFTTVNFRKALDKHTLSANGSLSFSKAEFGYAETDISIENRDLFTSLTHQYSTEQYEIKSGIQYDGRYQFFDGTFYQFDYAEGPEYPTLSSSNEQWLHRLEGFTYGKLFLGDKFIIGSGIRKNLPLDNQSSYLSSQLNLRYSPSDRFSVQAAIGQYNKYDLVQNQDESFRFLQSEQISLDFKYTNDGFNSTLSVFKKTTEQMNTTTDITGLELFIRKDFGSKLTGQASFAMINGTAKSEEFTAPAPYDLNYFVRGNLRYAFNSYWEMNAVFLIRDGRYHQPVIGSTFDDNLQVFEPQYAQPDEQVRLPGYQTFDISINRMFPINERLTLIAFASVNNLFNIKNTRSYIYNFDYSLANEALFSRRTGYFGVVINF